MTSQGALQHALDLAATPGLARVMRRQPLPGDVLMIIQIAARNGDTMQSAASSTGRRPEVVREAAVLYLQQVLFTRDADAYRILGVAPGAPQELIGQHMRWLMKWLHPDRDRGDWESAFAERVSRAWDDLKSPAKRAEYDRRTPGGQSDLKRARRGRHHPTFRRPWIERAPQPDARIPLRRLIVPALAVIAIGILLFSPGGLLSHGTPDELVVDGSRPIDRPDRDGTVPIKTSSAPLTDPDAATAR
jgi:hypothetical protein